MSTSCWMIGAKRTPVAPRCGAYAGIGAPELGSLVVRALLDELRVPADLVDCCVFANGLYGGGNPARVSALAAGIPESVPSLTIDTQCCGGLDAIHLARSLVISGAHDFVLAGGLESYSTAPRRFRRSSGGGPDEEYSRPPFTPWVDRDPDMLDAAFLLSAEMNISRSEQEAYACKSHAVALKSRQRMRGECVSVRGLVIDSFTREMSRKLCCRLPLIAGDSEHGLTAATVAVEADASAVCAIVSGDFLNSHSRMKTHALDIIGGISVGSDPTVPGLAPVAAVRETLDGLSLSR